MASIILAGAADIFFDSRKYAFIAILLLMSVPTFLLGMNYIRVSRKTLCIHLFFNLALLLFTFQDRLYYINLFMLSFILWQFVTPFVIKYKGIIGLTFLAAFLAAYITQLYGIKVPLIPFVYYPLYLLGYELGKKGFSKTKRVLLMACANMGFSAAALAFFFYKLTSYTNIAALNLLSGTTPDPLAAIYLPFWTVFLIWFFISTCLLAAYFYKFLSREPSYAGDQDEFIKGLARDAFSFMRFFIISGIFLLTGECVIRGNIRETLGIITDPSAMFNLFCLCSIYFFAISLIGKTLSTILISLIMLVLTLGNFLKIKYFNEPLYPWDTYIIKEAITISKEYVNLPVIFCVLVLLLIGFGILLGLKKSVRSFFKPKLTLGLIPFSLAILLVTGYLFYSPQHLIKLNIAKSWYIGKGEMISNGMLVQTFFYFKDYDQYVLSEPKGYSKAAMEEIRQRLGNEFPSVDKPSVKPNIILIMSESYWNPTKFHDVTFSSDILKGYNQYKKGETLSPAIGGGTANVEFEALTGLTNYFMGSGVLAYNIYFRRNTPGLVSVMNDNGYQTTAIHPFLATMYNRNKVYKYMQFNKFLSIDDFNVDTDLKGPYVSDDKLMDKVLETLENGTGPQFIFALSMQNHDPYVNKYSKLAVTAKSDKLNEDELGLLSTYAQGINDASNALDKLIKALEKTDKPTLVYFFGDHLPRLGSLQDLLDIYEKLNPEPDENKKALRSYSTPYASWSNFKETRAFDTPFSPSHIAYEILKDSGVEYPSYFNVLAGLEKEHLILQKDVSGQVDFNDQYIKDYRLIQYDIILGKQYLTQAGK